ncbi:MAG: DNA-processing protein DprA [Prevotella sp.]|nr:DNA-processing protein DprA [Prevotella sp.]
MSNDDILYTIALTKLGYISPDILLRIIQQAGSGKTVYETRDHLEELLPESSQRLKDIIGGNWNDAIAYAKNEMEFCQKNNISILCYGDNDYPQRLNECPDAPVVLYYKGNANLNCHHVINIIGTRHCTNYGSDVICRFISDLKKLCPEVLIVSGLAYGVDINAHKYALDNGFNTVGVLAHGLDTLYPSMHRETATKMIEQGGLLTEYMSNTRIDKQNFIRRNRIVAGISDACILVESAKHGGGLITARISQDYGRDVFAVPGRTSDHYSQGCNSLIHDNQASLLLSAEDFVLSMGWENDKILEEAKSRGIELSLFPELTDEQQAIANTLEKFGDLQLNILMIKTGFTIGKLNQLLFEMEMNGIVRPMAGGNYHLIK